MACSEYKEIFDNKDKVSGFKKRRKSDIDNVLSKGFWNIKELEIIIYNILYQKVECINDILPLLNNKTLDDLAKLLSYDLTIRGVATHKIKVNCDVCGKEYLENISVYVKEKPNHNYCSFECRNKGFIKFGSHKGYKNSRYNSIMIKCTNCGKEYLAPKYVQEQTNSYGENNHFCCQKCYWEYRHKHYVKDKNGIYGTKFSKERCKRMSIMITKRIAKGEFPQTATKPHIIIDNILQELNVSYINEYNCKYYSLDIYLDDYNLGIEIMGDYWHGSPIKYKEEDLSDIQLKSRKRDKSKHTYIKKYHKFEILYLWENDIINKTNLCKSLINLYIKNKGILKDYNSFNYYVNDNKTMLKNKIIYPYFIRHNA